MEKLLYTPEEAAAVLAVGRDTIYRYIHSGDLRRVKLGKLTRITAADLEAFGARLLAEDEITAPLYGGRLRVGQHRPPGGPRRAMRKAGQGPETAA
jgi:excisionase family DNA binding protein